MLDTDASATDARSPGPNLFAERKRARLQRVRVQNRTRRMLGNASFYSYRAMRFATAVRYRYVYDSRRAVLLLGRRRTDVEHIKSIIFPSPCITDINTIVMNQTRRGSIPTSSSCPRTSWRCAQSSRTWDARELEGGAVRRRHFLIRRVLHSRAPRARSQMSWAATPNARETPKRTV
jgi:hypothetical protein